MQTVAETPIFSRRADALLSAEERADLIAMLAADPEAGTIVPGLAGIRKLRFAPKDKGKSGGFRVLYYFFDEEMPILALLLYGKNEQANPTPEQRKVIVKLVESLKAARRN